MAFVIWGGRSFISPSVLHNVNFPFDEPTMTDLVASCCDMKAWGHGFNHKT